MRKHWNGHQGKFFLFFQAQALIVALFALPLLIAASNPVGTVTIWTIAAIADSARRMGGSPDCAVVGRVMASRVPHKSTARSVLSCGGGPTV